MKSAYLRLCLSALVTLFSSAVWGEEIRDYYAEPGMNPFKETVDQSFHESIDPFGGVLQLHYTDMVVPGNGGLDIRVTRSYTSLQRNLEPEDASGVGWTMHFGRIVVPVAYRNMICAQAAWQNSTGNNPSLEHPDGARELLVLRQDGSGGLITKSNWKFDCSGDSRILTAPNGTVYDMGEVEVAGDNWRWLPRRITDVHGNYLILTYHNLTNGVKAIVRIDASDGRYVDFEYNNNHLQNVISNGQRINYQYRKVEGVGGNYQYLWRVVRPDTLMWQYDYYPMNADGTAGSFNLKKVTYPHGATVDYTYQHVYFHTGTGFPGTAVLRKKTGGRGVKAGTWTYTFSPGSVELPETGAYLDQTVVDTPVGQERFFHYGSTYFVDSTGKWAIGLLYKHEVYQANKLRERRLHGWSSRQISAENYGHGAGGDDIGTYAPLLTSVWINRDGYSAGTVYSDYDQYGNPGRVTRTSTIQGYPDKVTDLTYYNNEERWIIGVTKDETLQGVGTIGRTFNDLGELVEEDRYGVPTTYTYWEDGSVHVRTDARRNATTYSDYYRGIAQTEARPEGVTIYRGVNDTGTLAWEKNGRGYTRQFAYDDLNRLEGITYPKGKAVSLAYSETGSSVARGNFLQSSTIDGFGNTTAIATKDKSSGITVKVTYKYDALGRRTFQSYPNATVGDAFVLDVLGRTTKVTHSDNTKVVHAYKGFSGHDVIDESGKKTSYMSVAYGGPDDAALIDVRADGGNAVTMIARNPLNQPISITQGGIDPVTGQYHEHTRSYEYDGYNYLISATNPESGTTAFGRDLNGNMTSRRIGDTQGIEYVYDNLDRPTDIKYPSGTPSVTRKYDKNNNVIYVGNGVASITYRYDSNDNLTTETSVIEVPGGSARTYVTAYGIDALDHRKSITYPSGRVVALNPDALGRPTTAGSYVTNIAHHATGQVSGMVYANGIATSITLDPRNRTHHILANGVSDIEYEYFPNSNVSTITDHLDAARTRSLTYDGLNRLDTARGAFGTIDYDYDGVGNMRVRTGDGNAVVYEYGNDNRLHKVSEGLRERGYGYDGHGNVATASVVEVATGASLSESSFGYNLADQLVDVRKEESGFTPVTKQFAYDGSNMRVRSVAGGKVTHYLYAKSGELMGEYGVTDAKFREHIYVGRQLAATVTNNEFPVAVPGQDKNVGSGLPAVLDGNGSYDSDGVIVAYAWAQLTGPACAIADPASSTTTIQVPADGVGQRARFRLTVTDDYGESASAEIALSITGAPVADAGPDQIAPEGSTVTLSGVASTGVDPMAYEWSATDPSVVLTNAATATPSFVAPSGYEVHRNYAITLKVTDGTGVAATDVVTVKVLSATADEDGDGLPDVWEFAYFGGWTIYDGASDPDGDGISNAVEYAENTSPVSANPPTPVAVVKGRAGVATNMIEWESVPSVSSYDLYWSTSPDFELAAGNLVPDVRSPVFQPGLLNGTAYYYAVVSSNATGSAAKSQELTLVPAPGSWQAAVGTRGTVLASNARGCKVVLWTDSSGGVYRVNARRFTRESGWGGEEVVGTSTKSIYSEHLRGAINERGDIVVLWLQNDAVTGNKVQVRAAAYMATTGTWGGASTVSRGLNSVYKLGEPVIQDDLITIVWLQSQQDGYTVYRHVFGASGSRNDFYWLWSTPLRLDADAADGCGDSTNVRVAVTPRRHRVFGWARCGVNVLRATTEAGLRPEVKLQAEALNPTDAFDLATSDGRVWAIAVEGGVLKEWEFDTLTNTLGQPAVVRAPVVGSVTSAYMDVDDVGAKAYVWIEQNDATMAAELYALSRTDGGDTLKLLGADASTLYFTDLQSFIGHDRVHVVAWGQLGGTVKVARGITGAWTTQTVYTGGSDQYTAIDGLGGIDTLSPGIWIRSFGP